MRKPNSKALWKTRAIDCLVPLVRLYIHVDGLLSCSGNTAVRAEENITIAYGKPYVVIQGGKPYGKQVWQTTW